MNGHQIHASPNGIGALRIPRTPSVMLLLTGFAVSKIVYRQKM